MEFYPLRDLKGNSDLKKGDVLVVFGELFHRGYANGLVKQARKLGMTIITGTVGRRDSEGGLRPLTEEELAEKNEAVVNVPLEAGFDLVPGPEGQSAVDMLSGLKMSQWKEAKLNWSELETAQKTAAESFKQRTTKFLEELEKHHIPEGANVLFAHLMAGGFPRAKVVMPAANRVFKGSGSRYASSEEFWSSDIGKLCEKNFNEVTGETLDHLITLSSNLRKKIEGWGGRVSYTAYGYHGTEVLINNELTWQSYAPYLQGWAKVHLEKIAAKHHKQGVAVCVFNAPEILTNSSSIFLGVEVPLYNLMQAIEKVGTASKYQALKDKCNSLLKEEHSIDTVFEKLNSYFTHSAITRLKQWDLGWPQHNDPEQMELMRNLSSEIIDMHEDKKSLLTAELSEIVADTCGIAMFDEGQAPRSPVAWIGHDLVAKLYCQ